MTVVSDVEKARKTRQVGIGKASASGFAVDVSKKKQMTSKPGCLRSPGRAWRVPADGPGGVRHGGDASPVCGFCMEREKAGCDTARSGLRAGEREKPVR